MIQEIGETRTNKKHAVELLRGFVNDKLDFVHQDEKKKKCLLEINHKNGQVTTAG